MRDIMIKIWRKLTCVKILTPIIVFIRWFAGTNFFNTVLDFMEVKIFHTSYKEAEGFYKENFTRIKNIEQMLADEKSRKVYDNIWKYRISHNRKYLRGIVDKDQYFDKTLIKLNNEEGFVDCGAYKGDTIKKFYKHLPEEKSYEFIVAFEPDKYNFSKLQKYVQKEERFKNKVFCYQVGTWNEKTELHFRSNTEEACMIREDGDTVIKTECIDSIVGENKVSYIKMDVEGAELNSLKGAEQVIEREHPRLAISIYHSEEDMIQIIEYIKRQYPFYKLYVRHYTYFFADTVLYAIEE